MDQAEPLEKRKREARKALLQRLVDEGKSGVTCGGRTFTVEKKLSAPSLGMKVVQSVAADMLGDEDAKDFMHRLKQEVESRRKERTYLVVE